MKHLIQKKNFFPSVKHFTVKTQTKKGRKIEINDATVLTVVQLSSSMLRKLSNI